MIKWLNQEVIPATHEDMHRVANQNGRVRVYSVDRKTGKRVVETMQGTSVVPIYDGSLEARQRLIRKTRAMRGEDRQGQAGLGGAWRGEAWHGKARQGKARQRRELRQSWSLVELIIRYLVRQQERAIK